MQSRFVGVLTGRRLPLAHRQSFSHTRAEIGLERAIMFAFEKARNLVIEDACKEDQGRRVALLHLVLAEEAYEQFTQLARFSDRQAEDSLHGHSRLITAIYHGAASLDNALSIDLGDIRLDPGAALPLDPVARWVKLYSQLYLKFLDKQALEEMVRRYDAAQTKLDILQLLARPQLWRGNEREALWDLPGSTAAQTDGEAAFAAVFADFEFQFRRAEEAVGRGLQPRWRATVFHPVGDAAASAGAEEGQPRSFRKNTHPGSRKTFENGLAGFPSR